MNFNIKNIAIIVLLIIIFLAGFFVSKHFSKNKIEDLRKEIIKNDSLVQIDSVTYKKLVADTLTKRQLRKEIKDLKVSLKDPKTITKIKFVPRDIIKKEIDTVTITKDTIINVVDFYPNKSNPFIRYSAQINYPSKNSFSNWEFYPQNINLVIGKNDIGMYEVVSKVPEFIKINSVDVLSKPITANKKDNFGFLFGAGYGKDFRFNTEYLTANAGIRFKKTYILFNINTNETANIGLNFEF